MNNFRRDKQITDTEIKAFKEMQINEILEKVKNPKTKYLIKKPFALAGVLVLTSLLIVLSFFILNSNKKDYSVSQLTYNEFLLESNVDDSKFKLYYKASVFHIGQRIPYQDTFEYYAPYLYVDDDIANQYKVQFEVFKVSQYRYFLQVKFNNRISYLEVNYYPQHSLDKELKNLEINDWEKDFAEIYKWIENYPPILVSSSSSLPKYSIDPRVSLLENSKEKRNYIHYVQNYYVSQDYKVNSQDHSQEKNITIYQHHLITVDKQGDLIEASIHGSYAFGVSPDPYQVFTKIYEDLFDFYLVGKDRPLGTRQYSLQNDDYGLEGYYRLANYEEDLYIYTYISLNHSNTNLDKVSYGNLSYTLSPEFENKVINTEFQPIYYNQALIIPLIFLSENIESDNYIDSFTYEFYDEKDQLIHSFTNK